MADKEVLELGEIPAEEPQEPTVTDDKDYKRLWEEEQERVENISKNYKQEEANKNKLLHTLAKLKGALEVNGIAEIDDEFNITLKQRQDVSAQSPTTSIDEQIKELKQQNKDGEIEFDDYTEKLADLISEKKMQEYERKVQEIQKKDKEAQGQKVVVETQQAEQAKVWDYLETNYADHNVPNSRLQQEMGKVVSENQHIYTGIDLTKPENIRWRLKLAEEAHNSLVAQGLAKAKATATASRQNFSTMQGDKGTPPADGGMNEEQRYMMKGFLNDPKLAKQINKMAATINSNSALILEG
jgi:hypothetical protein